MAATPKNADVVKVAREGACPIFSLFCVEHAIVTKNFCEPLCFSDGRYCCVNIECKCSCVMPSCEDELGCYGGAHKCCCFFHEDRCPPSLEKIGLAVCGFRMIGGQAAARDGNYAPLQESM